MKIIKFAPIIVGACIVSLVGLGAASAYGSEKASSESTQGLSVSQTLTSASTLESPGKAVQSVGTARPSDETSQPTASQESGSTSASSPTPDPTSSSTPPDTTHSSVRVTTVLWSVPNDAVDPNSQNQPYVASVNGLHLYEWQSAFANVLKCGTRYQVDVYNGDWETLKGTGNELVPNHDGGYLAYNLVSKPYDVVRTAECPVTPPSTTPPSSTTPPTSPVPPVTSAPPTPEPISPSPTASAPVSPSPTATPITNTQVPPNPTGTVKPSPTIGTETAQNGNAGPDSSSNSPRKLAYTGSEGTGVAAWIIIALIVIGLVLLIIDRVRKYMVFKRYRDDLDN